MPNREYSLEVKQRFVQAIDVLSKENYPLKKESDIIKSVGLTTPNYTRIKASTNNYPTIDNCILLLRTYNISAEWLFNGTGIMKKLDNKELTPIEIIKEAIKLL